MPGVGTTHHVKIGDIYAQLMPGGYRQRFAPLRGARVASGDPDYNDLSVWQVWNQHCWAGGLGADKWVDDAMYDTGVGLDTTIKEQCSLSRDLAIATGGGLDANSLGWPGEFIVYRKPNGVKRLYFITYPDSGSGIGSELWKYTEATNSWAVAKLFPSSWQATCITAHSGELAIGFDNGRIKSAANPDNTSGWVNRNKPRGIKSGVTAMMRYRQRLYVAYGRQVYRRKWNWKIDGKTAFYNPHGGGEINGMEVHLGFLYMSSRNGHIHRSDGNSTHDIWSWDGGTEVVSMRSFDGRLFIGTYEFNDDKRLGTGHIYQMTGSAVTQLKSWGENDRATVLGKFREYDRKLYYGASALWSMNKDVNGTDYGGFGVAIYDPIEDAHSIWATNKDTTTYPDASGTGNDWIVWDTIYYRGRLHASVQGHGIFNSTVAYRDYIDGTVNYDTTTTTAAGGTNNGFLISSDYDGGTPGLDKLWRFGQVEAFLPSNNVSVTLSYSVDRGASWTQAGVLSRVLTGTSAVTVGLTTLTGTGTAYKTELQPGDEIVVDAETVVVDSIESDTAATLRSAAASSDSGSTYLTKKQHTRKFYISTTDSEVVTPRLMYRLALKSSSGTETPTVQSVQWWYLPEPEPNWIWDLTVAIAERVQLLDGTDDTQNIETQLQTIREYARDQKIITFTDREGNTWDALVWDYVEDYHVSGKAGEPKEAFLRLSILEVNDA